MPTSYLLSTVSDSTTPNINPVIIFQGVNDGLTDETTKLQLYLTNFRNVKIAPNTTVVVTKRISIPSDTVFEGFGLSSVIKAGSSISQTVAGTTITNQVLKTMFSVGDRVTVRGLKFNGNNLLAGGILCSVKSDLLVENCEFTDMATNAEANAGVAISLDVASRVRIYNCRMYRTFYPVECWECTDVIVRDCKSDIARGGFWTARSFDVYFVNCETSNNADVGFDFEGGARCYAIGGYSYSANNGELALFDGATATVDEKLQFIGVKVRRTATYTTLAGTSASSTGGNGALYVNTLTAASKDCGAKDCEFWIEYDRAFSLPSWTAGTATTSDITFFFTDNVIHHSYASPLFKINGTGRGIRVANNTWNILVDPTNPAEFKNTGRAYFGNNIFIVASGVTLTNHLIRFYEDQGSSLNANCRVVRNEFHNAGRYAAKLVGQARTFILEENIFSTRAEEFGGLEIENNTSLPLFVRQPLLVKPAAKATAGTSETIDFTSTADFSNVFTTSVAAPFGVSADITLEATVGTLTNAYKMFIGQNVSNGYVLKNQDAGGVGSGTGSTSSTTMFLASVATSVATWTKASGASVQFRVNMVLNSQSL